MPEHEMNGEQSDVLVGLAPADWAAADEIRRRRFAHAPNGYSPEEVHDFLDKLAGMFANLRTQVAELRRVPPAGPAPIEGGTAVSGMAVRMADVLREADSHAASVRQEADRETARLLAEARQEAERTVNEARHEADRMVVAARSDAEQSAAGHLQEVQRTMGQAAAQSAGLIATARDEAERILTTAREEADRVRSDAGDEALQARRESERNLAEAAAIREAVLAELRGAFDRIASVVPDATETSDPGFAQKTEPAWDFDPIAGVDADVITSEGSGGTVQAADPPEDGVTRPDHGELYS